MSSCETLALCATWAKVNDFLLVLKNETSKSTNTTFISNFRQEMIYSSFPWYFHQNELIFSKNNGFLVIARISSLDSLITEKLSEAYGLRKSWNTIPGIPGIRWRTTLLSRGKMLHVLHPEIILVVRLSEIDDKRVETLTFKM